VAHGARTVTYQSGRDTTGDVLRLEEALSGVISNSQSEAPDSRTTVCIAGPGVSATLWQ
jgi:hypothetical protein